MNERKKETALSCEFLGGENSAERRSMIEETIKRYSSAKKKTYEFALFLYRILPHVTSGCNENYDAANKLGANRLGKIAESVLTCGSFFVVREYLGGIFRVAYSFTCKHPLFCIGCALRRSARFVKAYQEKVEQVLKENPNLVPMLMTITVKDGENVLERFLHLSKVMQTILERRRAASKSNRIQRYSPFRHIFGGVGSYEFKRGSGSGEWHVHLHLIVLIDRNDWLITEELVKCRKKEGFPQMYKRIYVPKELVSLCTQELWMCSGDSFIMDIRGLYPRNEYGKLVPLSEADQAKPIFEAKHIDGNESEDTPDSLFSGLCEAFKYAVKPEELTHEDWLQVACLLQGRRLYFSFGNLYGVKVVVPDDDKDLIEDKLKDLPYVERIYKYHHIYGRYLPFVTHEKGKGEWFPDSGRPKKQAAKKKTPRVKVEDGTKEDVQAWLEQQNAELPADPFPELVADQPETEDIHQGEMATRTGQHSPFGSGLTGAGVPSAPQTAGSTERQACRPDQEVSSEANQTGGEIYGYSKKREREVPS